MGRKNHFKVLQKNFWFRRDDRSQNKIEITDGNKCSSPSLIIEMKKNHLRRHQFGSKHFRRQNLLI